MNAKRRGPAVRRKPNARVIYKAHASPEWFTPTKIRELARLLLGGVAGPACVRGPITCDPATIALNPLGADIAITRGDAVIRGLRRTPESSSDAQAYGKAWAAAITRATRRARTPQPLATLYLNPPFGKEIAFWLEALEVCRRALGGRLASLVLVPARVGAGWYEQATTSADVVCELRGRLVFEVLRRGKLEPARDGAGKPQGARWGCVLLYTGPQSAWVRRRLGELGAARYGRSAANRRGRAIELRKRERKAQNDRQLELAHTAGGNVIPLRKADT